MDPFAFSDGDSGYDEWLEQVARASGIETPTRKDLIQLDRKRPKKGSNEDWMHPHDPEARITKMKDGSTHLAHKLEQAVDMETGALVAVTVQTMAGGDVASLPNTLDEAERQLEVVQVVPEEVVADKGYHSNKTMTGMKERKLRSYVSEPDRGRRSWKRNRDAQQPTCANRRRIRGNRGKAAATPARREGGAGVCPLACDRRAASRPHTGPGGDSKTDADPRGGLQPRPSHAQAVRGWNPACVTGPRYRTSCARNSGYNPRFAPFPPYSAPFRLPRAEYRLFRPHDPLLAEKHRARTSVFSPNHHPLETHFFHGLLGRRGPGRHPSA